MHLSFPFTQINQTLSGTVATYADLPSAAAYTGQFFRVTTASGTIFVDRHAAGVYVSDGSTWIYAADFSENDQASEIQNDSLVAGTTVADALNALMVSPGTVVDNSIPRMDGTGGRTTQPSGVIIDDTTNSMYGFGNKIVTQANTTYTLQASDTGKILKFTNSSSIVLTIPQLTAEFTCGIVQEGAGQITFTPSSTTMRNRSTHTKTAGQYAVCGILFTSTSVFYLSGDTTL